METSRLLELPDELLAAIVFHLPPSDTVAFGTTCRQCNKLTYEPLVWRRHCTLGWHYWDASHCLLEKLTSPPAQTQWRQLYNIRKQTDQTASTLFENMLKTQQYRIQRMEDIAAAGYDVKDLLLKLDHDTSDQDPKVLAKKYHAKAILGQIHRSTAIEKWNRLQTSQTVSLEEVLGAFDLFVVAGKHGDLSDISQGLDRIAQAIRATDPDFDHLSTRAKSVQIAKYLRSEQLVGISSEEDYHALRNNFISMALFDTIHTSLPLQSVAIYCAVARRLGVNAKPSNYPHHVHAVIEPPQGVTLDGKTKQQSSEDDEPERMHMDPWRSIEELPQSQLVLRLSQMGVPPVQHAYYLDATSNFEVALRTGRNIMNSVQEARESQRGLRRSPFPDVESAWYSMLWSMLILGGATPTLTLHRRRQSLPYLIEHYQAHFPEDLGLIERIINPMFVNEREHHVIWHLVTCARKSDGNKKAPSPRGEETKNVRYKVGQRFQHRRYGYEGFIIGWDTKCGAENRWIQQMRVDELPRGRHQPFYNIVAEDKSVRYVAEENIGVLEDEPSEILLDLAGRYFNRWDAENATFVSNMRDEYPDD